MLRGTTGVTPYNPLNQGSLNQGPSSDPQPLSYSRVSNNFREYSEGVVNLLRSPPATLAKLGVGVPMATAVTLNFFVLFAVFNALNIIHSDTVKNKAQMTEFIKASNTFGAGAELINTIIGTSWGELVKKPYYDTLQTIFAREGGELNEDLFNNRIKHELQLLQQANPQGVQNAYSESVNFASGDLAIVSSR